MWVLIAKERRQPKAKRVKSRKGKQKKEGEREGKRTDLTGLSMGIF